MKWIEIIELRSAGTSCNLLEVQLKEFMEQLANKSSKQMVKFYRYKHEHSLVPQL